MLAHEVRKGDTIVDRWGNRHTVEEIMDSILSIRFIDETGKRILTAFHGDLVQAIKGVETR